MGVGVLFLFLITVLGGGCADFSPFPLLFSPFPGPAPLPVVFLGLVDRDADPSERFLLRAKGPFWRWHHPFIHLEYGFLEPSGGDWLSLESGREGVCATRLAPSRTEQEAWCGASLETLVPTGLRVTTGKGRVWVWPKGVCAATWSSEPCLEKLECRVWRGSAAPEPVILQPVAAWSRSGPFPMEALFFRMGADRLIPMVLQSGQLWEGEQPVQALGAIQSVPLSVLRSKLKARKDQIPINHEGGQPLLRRPGFADMASFDAWFLAPVEEPLQGVTELLSGFPPLEVSEGDPEFLCAWSADQRRLFCRGAGLFWEQPKAWKAFLKDLPVPFYLGKRAHETFQAGASGETKKAEKVGLAYSHDAASQEVYWMPRNGWPALLTPLWSIASAWVSYGIMTGLLLAEGKPVKTEQAAAGHRDAWVEAWTEYFLAHFSEWPSHPSWDQDPRPLVWRTGPGGLCFWHERDSVLWCAGWRWRTFLQPPLANFFEQQWARIPWVPEGVALLDFRWSAQEACAVWKAASDQAPLQVRCEKGAEWVF